MIFSLKITGHNNIVVVDNNIKMCRSQSMETIINAYKHRMLWLNNIIIV